MPKANLDVPANQGAPIPRAGTEASFTSSAPKWWSLSVAERLIAENIDGRESTVLFLNCSCVQNVSKMEVSLGIHQDLLFLLISTGERFLASCQQWLETCCRLGIALVSNRHSWQHQQYWFPLGMKENKQVEGQAWKGRLYLVYIPSITQSYSSLHPGVSLLESQGRNCGCPPSPGFLPWLPPASLSTGFVLK